MELQRIAQLMVAPGKGILAADESLGTIEKRFQKINLPSTEEYRRAYRDMLFTTPRIGEYISGVIMFDETLRHRTTDGKTFVDVLNGAGVLPGIKVDGGTMDMPGSQPSQNATAGTAPQDGSAGSPQEKLTKGLDGLPARLADYKKLGALFTKWRAVITIGEGIPTDANIRQNAKDLAAYAAMAQAAGFVPMVEPEVLMDGGHTMAQCEDATLRILSALFEELKKADVLIEGLILKTNMVLPGKASGIKAAPVEVAEATLRVLQQVLPNNLPGVTFLSGGQGEVEATANLNAINKIGEFPWKLTFSYSRALLDSALVAWTGKEENVSAAQKVFYHRAEMNSLASLGQYNGEIEVI